MNVEDIVQMATEAGALDGPVTTQVFERFAALVAAAEREECAKIADSFNDNCPTCDARFIARVIRARGETK